MIVHSLIGVVELYIVISLYSIGIGYRVWPKGLTSSSFFIPTPPTFALMARTGGRSDSWEIESGADGQRDRFSGLEAHVQQPDEWWEAILEISTQIEPLALRRMFLGLVNSERETKRQVCAFNLYDFVAWVTESI